MPIISQAAHETLPYQIRLTIYKFAGNHNDEGRPKSPVQSSENPYCNQTDERGLASPYLRPSSSATADEILHISGTAAKKLQ